MSTDEKLNSDTRGAQTRMPFRAGEFALGVLFIGIGLLLLLAGATPGGAFVFAALVALAGVQLVYSASSGGWKPAYLEAGRHVPPRFLMVEPTFFVTEDSLSNRRSDAQTQDINPYSPPLDLPATAGALESPSQESPVQFLTRQFLDGRPFIHYGVVFFLDAGDDTAIHAALPLASSSGLLMRRNTNEAIRVLPELLSMLPDASAALRDRDLVVRAIASYSNLHDEVCDRIVVPRTTLSLSHSNQPAGERTR